jgi:hypothetical protein
MHVIAADISERRTCFTRISLKSLAPARKVSIPATCVVFVVPRADARKYIATGANTPELQHVLTPGAVSERFAESNVTVSLSGTLACGRRTVEASGEEHTSFVGLVQAIALLNLCHIEIEK